MRAFIRPHAGHVRYIPEIPKMSGNPISRDLSVKYLHLGEFYRTSSRVYDTDLHPHQQNETFSNHAN